MTTVYLKPDGDDAKDGVSHDTAWSSVSRVNRFLREEAGPGDRVLIRSGGVYRGSLEVACPFPISFDRYDGKARPVLISEDRDGLSYSGTGGFRVRGLAFQGSNGHVEANHAGVSVGAEARDLEIDDVEASGYMLAGILLNGGEQRDVTIRGGILHHNANGLHVSGPSIRDLRILDVEASDNDLRNPLVSGFGMSINGVEGVQVIGGKVFRNGRRGLGGQSGLMFYLCRNFTARHVQAWDNHDPNPQTGDGQGIVADDSWEGVIEHCDVRRNMNGGIQIHDEFQGSSPRNIVVRDNYVEDNIVGLDHQGGAGNILWENNVVVCRSSDGAYRAALGFYDPRPGVRFRLNTFQAYDGAHLLVSDLGLRGVTFDQDKWLSDRPSFLVRGIQYLSLADAVRIESTS